jgi:hypothetical protein
MDAALIYGENLDKSVKRPPEAWLAGSLGVGVASLGRCWFPLSTTIHLIHPYLVRSKFPFEQTLALSLFGLLCHAF